MGEEFAAQSINHPVAEGRSDENLGVGEKPSQHRKQHNGAGGFHQEQGFAVGHEALKKTQDVRQRLIQDGVIQDDLERPGLQEVGGDDSQGA